MNDGGCWGERQNLKAPLSCGKRAPLGSCPVAHMNRSNTPYLLRFLFYELGHFHGDGLLPVVFGAIAPVEKGDQSWGVWGGFTLGWIHELRTRN